MNDCFLCEQGKCYLFTPSWKHPDLDNFRVYCSIRPDLDPNSRKPLHVLLAPQEHYKSTFEMPLIDYLEFMIYVREVKNFYLSKGYGPAVTTLILEPGPHTPHPHAHLIFSSNPLWPLKEGVRDLVDDNLLAFLKEEAKLFPHHTKPLTDLLENLGDVFLKVG